MADDRHLAQIVRRLDPDAVAERVIAKLRASLDGYANLAGQDSLDEVTDIARQNVDVFVRRLLHGSGPEDAEIERLRESARHRAGEGLPLEQMLQAYRLGARVTWSMLLELADDDDERASLLGAVDVLLAHVDLVSSLVERTYLDARERWVSESERHVRQALVALEDDHPLSPAEQALLQAVGVPLQRSYVPFALAVPGGSVIRHAQLAAWIRSRGIGVAVTEGDRVSGVAWQEPALADVGLGPSGILALSSAAPRAELAAARREARLLADLLLERGITGRVRVDDHLPELLVAGSPRLGRAAVDRVLGPLEAPGAEDLRTTLLTLLEHDFDRRRAGEALHIHRNTLTYRIGRIEDLTGLDLRRGRDVALVYLAVAFVQLHKRR